MAWYLDGVNLSSLAWNVSNRSAGWAVPGKAGSNTKVPGRHGAFWNKGKTFEEGHLSLSMWAAGCNHDGSLPMEEDGRKKVRDNLDRLTSLFATSSKLLSLRQITGTEMPIINEMTNPNLSSTLNSGITLARNYAVDPTRASSSVTEISTNHSTNPLMKGRESLTHVITEDLYPDPQFFRNIGLARKQHFRSYYSPIRQNAASVNRFFTPNNGFVYTTGRPGQIGTFSRSTDITWTGETHIGDLQINNIPNPDRGVDFFMNMKLSSNSPATSVNIAVRTSVSTDGVSWTSAPAKTFPINKNTYTWMHIPASSLPSMGSASSFSVRYHLRIMTPTSWKAGAYFDVDKVTVQEGTAPNNPWRSTMNPSLIFDGYMDGVAWAGVTALSDSVFKPSPAPEWEAVISPSTSTTAPFASAYTQKIDMRGELSFSVFGGSYQTFRRELATPQYSLSGTKIWGRVFNSTSKTATIKVLERTGSAGSYTYTPVRSHIIPALGQHQFTSEPFDITKGKTYVMEVVAPSGPDFGPTLAFDELHVSNGWINTNIPRGLSQFTYGPSAQAQYSGFAYQSSILGRSGYVPGTANGLPDPDSPLILSSSTDWNSAPSGALGINGELRFNKVTFASSIKPGFNNTITAQINYKVDVPSHIQRPIPTSGTGTLETVMYDADGVVTRTLTDTIDISYNDRGFTVVVQEGEVALRQTLKYSDSSNPFAQIKVLKYSVYTAQSQLVNSRYFTGAGMLEGKLETWQRLKWNGTPYFSTSTLAAPIPSVWNVEGFKTFNDSDSSIQFTGTALRVQHRAPAGRVYVGFRRGISTGTYTVAAKPEGSATATTLGSISPTRGFVQEFVTIPDNSTYIDFIFSGTATEFTVRDVFVIGDLDVGVYPVPNTQWVGFTAASAPSLTLPSHPNSQGLLRSTSIGADGTTSYQVGGVPGWSSPLMGGGYIPLPPGGSKHLISSHGVSVNKGFVSVAVVTDLSDDLGTRATLMVQGASDAERLQGKWSTLQTKTIPVTAGAETRIPDVSVGDKTQVRIAIEINNTTSLNRTGVAGILLGATLTPSPIALSTNWPGHFVGVMNSTGTSTYKSNIRQAWVEVVEAIDMSSTGLGTIAEFNVNMVVPGAFWEDIYDTSSTVTAPSTARSGTFLMNDFYGATAPMTDLVFTITPVSGTITNLTLEDVGSSNMIRISNGSHSSISINTTTSTVQDATGKSIIKDVSQVGTSTILSLTPYNRGDGDDIDSHVDGTPVLKWSCNTAIKVTVTGRRKYLLA